MTQNRNCTVIGAGLMGHGIALTLAKAGHNIAIAEPDPRVAANNACGCGTDQLKSGYRINYVKFKQLE